MSGVCGFEGLGMLSGIRLCSFSWAVAWRCGVGGEVDGVEGFYAAEADGGVGGILAYVGDMAPAAVALGALRARLDLDR